MQKINTIFMSFLYASLTLLMWHEEQRLSKPRFSVSKSSCLCCLRGAKLSCNQYVDLELSLRSDFSKTMHFRHCLDLGGISSIPQRCALTSTGSPIPCITPISHPYHLCYLGKCESDTFYKVLMETQHFP